MWYDDFKCNWLIETSMIREDGWTSSCDFLSASISLRRPIECLEGFPSFLPFSFVFILLSHARCPPLFHRFMDENDHTDLKVLHMGSPHGKPINFFGIFTFTPSNLFHDRSHLLQAIKLYWAPSIVHLICEIIFAWWSFCGHKHIMHLIPKALNVNRYDRHIHKKTPYFL